MIVSSTNFDTPLGTLQPNAGKATHVSDAETRVCRPDHTGAGHGKFGVPTTRSRDAVRVGKVFAIVVSLSDFRSCP